jgi:gamma-glutamyltranspeptidase/glutathione hydrolase/leukotriene-C4 hydrolase
MDGQESLLLNDEHLLPLNTRSHARLGRVLRFVAATSFFLVGFLGCYAHSIPFSAELTLQEHTNRNPSYLIRVKHGAVAAENKRCSDIGVDVLKEGGNAVDAAIAATFCIGVVNMFS